MRYTLDPVRGIVFEFDEPQPIPLDEAVEAIKEIAAKQEENLARCTRSQTALTTAAIALKTA
jgi:hypothetical protein